MEVHRIVKKVDFRQRIFRKQRKVKCVSAGDKVVIVRVRARALTVWAVACMSQRFHNALVETGNMVPEQRQLVWAQIGGMVEFVVEGAMDARKMCMRL